MNATLPLPPLDARRLDEFDYLAKSDDWMLELQRQEEASNAACEAALKERQAARIVPHGDAI